MTTYRLGIDGYAEDFIEANDQAASDEAKRRLDATDWRTEEHTTYIDWTLDRVEMEDTEEIDSGRLTIHPKAPECDDGEDHDWQSPYEIVGGIPDNPGIYGNGGGVIITECCMRCGTAKVTDTWTSHPNTGEQGLESVCYEEGLYREKLDRFLGESHPDDFEDI